MPVICENSLPTSRFPNQDVAILVARGNEIATWRPGYGEHAVGMIFTQMIYERGGSERAIIPIRNLGCLISTRRNDKIAIWRPGQGENCIISVPAVFKDEFSGIKMIAMLG